jgi:hypothetical protein
MKKLNQFTKSERVISLTSIIWIIAIFTVAFNESRGDFDEEFVGIFFIFGLMPVLLLIGVKWIKSAGKS